MFVLESTQHTSTQSPSPSLPSIVDTLAHFIAKGPRKKFSVLSLETLIEFALQKPELEFYSEVKRVISPPPSLLSRCPHLAF